MESTPHSPKSEVQSLFEADQKDRSEPNFEDSDDLADHDAERLIRVKELIQEGSLITPDDFYAASMILHHSGSVEDILQAHRLAQHAMQSGLEKAKWLTAATMDRYLMMNGEKYQKYGTQYRKNQETGKYVLYPVDSETSDEERVKLNLPALSEIKREWDDN